ncbi:winged helix-turn-helix domain-containing protein [Actinomadura decatromicini]|uniref:Winged helix-turn-helix transcriptional regulator n=1 Tax=Actinomadura decatromicini TaxID=2604572 RepID=A0A5D3FW38_9ACTN|nr:winged helix-turn-helix domain-containing protein [Actinomadura decatromicini]TYK53067.1 winged helix-turn-helix transcriptional regulator [Actinomadura decatromicini]
MTTISYPSVDLAQTRFALSPLGHLVHGVHDSACSRGSSLRRTWWHTARRNVPPAAYDLVARINADPSAPPTLLAPPLAGYGYTEPSFDTELQALEAASPDLNGTLDALRELYDACLADDWSQISRQLHADLGQRAATLLAEGPAAALASLHHGLAWRDERLIIPGPDSPGFDGTGGLVAMPCAFGQAALHPILAPGQVPILIYSIAPTPILPPSLLRDTLSSLIGPGRARSLRELAKSPASTSQLAHRLDVSVPAASMSATALRNSGLIQSIRDGRKVVHHLTPAATALLAANPAPTAPVLNSTRTRSPAGQCKK